MKAMPTGMEWMAGATFSEDRRYRYRLWRCWQYSGEKMLWIMLNPSTADALIDDATIRRCKSFARREGCGGIEVVNLYAYRATHPHGLVDVADAGRDPEEGEPRANERAWLAAIDAVGGGPVVAGWGDAVAKLRLNPSRALGSMAYLKPSCLGFTKAHHEPRHPVRLAGTEPLVPMAWVPQ